MFALSIFLGLKNALHVNNTLEERIIIHNCQKGVKGWHCFVFFLCVSAMGLYQVTS